MRNPVGVVRAEGMNWTPVYCANCGADGGLVPEEHIQFVTYICPKCEPSIGIPAHAMAVPDEVFFQRVADEQLEKYGRMLTPSELIAVLDNGDHPLTKLVRERMQLPEYKRERT